MKVKLELIDKTSLYIKSFPFKEKIIVDREMKMIFTLNPRKKFECYFFTYAANN